MNTYNKQLEYPEDIYLVGATTLAWAALHYILYQLVYKPLGALFFPSPKKLPKRIANAKGYEAQMAIVNDKRNKLYTALWKFTYFTLCAIMGIVVCSSESWIFSQKDYFQGWPNHPISLLMRMYYHMENAGYIYALLLMPFEPKQTVQDYIALVIHHGSTLFLLSSSYYYAYHRIGVVIALLHDLSDPFMEIAKVFLYSGRTHMADIFFGLFALVFIVTRNLFFPLFVIRSIPLYAYFPDGSKMPFDTFNTAAQVALWILEILHIYWASLILKMAYKAIVNKGVEDDIRNVDEPLPIKKQPSINRKMKEKEE